MFMLSHVGEQQKNEMQHKNGKKGNDQLEKKRNIRIESVSLFVSRDRKEEI